MSVQMLIGDLSRRAKRAVSAFFKTVGERGGGREGWENIEGSAKRDLGLEAGAVAAADLRCSVSVKLV